MQETHFQSKDSIRALFTSKMSEMFRTEVPQYDSLVSLVQKINNDEISSSPDLYSHVSDEHLEVERHGAIRLGTANELSNMRRLFAVMGMYPVDYYDLSVAGIPVHSTAFRPTSLESLKANPFRIFTSLLRLDLIDDEKLLNVAESTLSKRNCFSDCLLKLLNLHENQGGLNHEQAKLFITEALEVFRWHQEAQVDSQTYKRLNSAHPLIADVVSFKGPHINHLTPRSLNIDALQETLSKDFDAKKIVEGPPTRKCPILLRQTSFIALEENITFTDEKQGTHTARFGEVEQRGAALTPKGRKLYDELLNIARTNYARANKNSEANNYQELLEDAFSVFPDNHQSLHDEALAYYQYTAMSKPKSDSKKQSLSQLIKEGHLVITPILYEDFLPVSAAGIFTSNLSTKTNAATKNNTATQIEQSPNQLSFEKALGSTVIDSFSLYLDIQRESLDKALKLLSIGTVS